MPRGCAFDQTLEPGKTYRVVVPFRSGADTYAPGGVFGQFEWQTKAEYRLGWHRRRRPGAAAPGGRQAR
nr:hypothetical protein GCM10020092_004360 [Actinoplanes digitatis]